MAATLLLLRSLTAIVFALLAVCAGYDLRNRIIPNELSALVAVTGLTLSVLKYPSTFWISVAVAAALFVVLWPLVMKGVLGGGDVKLLSASTLLVPPQHVASLLVAVALAGGILSAGYLVAYVVLKAHGPAQHNTSLPAFWRKERSRVLAARSVPYGIAIVAGTVAVLVAEIAQ